jgi:aspartyl-tRNA(Asn)/glutamyl-tRNA(Gln) amidotransferase subunit A
MRDLHHLGVAELAALPAKAKKSAPSRSPRVCSRGWAVTRYDAFLDINSEAALAQARASDDKIAERHSRAACKACRSRTKTFSSPKTLPTTAGSQDAASGYRSPFDATVVRKLREAGMVTLGKLNCDEFAMGSSNENSAFGAVTQPLGRDPRPVSCIPAAHRAAAPPRWPRASHLRPLARTPAARSASPPRFAASPASSPPTGARSRYGMVAFASSLDQAGPDGTQRPKTARCC